VVCWFLVVFSFRVAVGCVDGLRYWGYVDLVVECDLLFYYGDRYCLVVVCIIFVEVELFGDVFVLGEYLVVEDYCFE